jgi:phosphoribosylpyrophosphate synthetase
MERKPYNKQVPISAADVAQILEFVGANKIISVDLHAPAVQGSVTAKVSFDDFPAGCSGA